MKNKINKDDKIFIAGGTGMVGSAIKRELLNCGFEDNQNKILTPTRSEVNLLNLNENNYLFHAGTKKKDDKVYAAGGRVLNFISLSKNFIDARENIHKNLEKLSWSKGFYRKDIGHKVINK